MTLRMALFVIAALTGLAASSARAQNVVDLDLGQTVSHKSGGKAEVFRFVGGVGTKVTATLTAPGDIALVFYTPDGEEMISAKANGRASLDLFLPFSDVYFVSVLRTDASMPFSLTLSGAAPDDQLAHASRDIGWGLWENRKQYPQCWLEPGLKYRIKGEHGLIDVTLGRGDKLTAVTQFYAGGTSVREAQVTFRGDMAEMSWDGAAPLVNGRHETPKAKRGPYHGYLCSDWPP